MDSQSGSCTMRVLLFSAPGVPSDNVTPHSGFAAQRLRK